MQPHANKKGDLKNVKKSKRAATVFWVEKG